MKNLPGVLWAIIHVKVISSIPEIDTFVLDHLQFHARVLLPVLDVVITNEFISQSELHHAKNPKIFKSGGFPDLQNGLPHKIIVAHVFLDLYPEVEKIF